MTERERRRAGSRADRCRERTRAPTVRRSGMRRSTAQMPQRGPIPGSLRRLQARARGQSPPRIRRLQSPAGKRLAKGRRVGARRKQLRCRNRLRHRTGSWGRPPRVWWNRAEAARRLGRAKYDTALGIVVAEKRVLSCDRMFHLGYLSAMHSRFRCLWTDESGEPTRGGYSRRQLRLCGENRRDEGPASSGGSF